MLYRLFFSLFLLSQFCFSQEHLNEVTICWDQSSSMTDRDLDKDFSYLADYFNDNPELEVTLLLFGIVVNEHILQISEGNWEPLKSLLNSVHYDGATVYKNLNDKLEDKQEVMIFTDGKRLFKRDYLFLPDNSVIVNSNAVHDLKYLERTALRSNSRFINLFQSSDVNKSSESSTVKHDNSKNSIKGVVYLDNKPFSNIDINIKGSVEGVTTDVDGNFNINAKVGDSLLVTNNRGRILKIVPIEFFNYTKIFLESSLIALDEVSVIEKKESIEYVSNGYNTYNKDALGYEVASIESDEITAIETSAGDAVKNKVAGVNVSTKYRSGEKGGLAATEIRGRHSINADSNAMVVIDGIPVNRSSVNDSKTDIHSGFVVDSDVADLSFIDPGNIEKISVLKGLAATNIWGAAGANGVILITTKTGGSRGSRQKIVEDRARLKNNIYNENNEITDQGSSYLKAFKSSKSIENAYLVYNTLKEVNTENKLLYLDAFSYFMDKDKQLAMIIISNLWENEPENVDVLKLLSLAFISVEDYDMAELINKEIIALRSKDVNTHLNQALVFKEKHKAKLAYNKLDAMLNGNTKYDLNTSGVSKTLNREIKNLVFTSKSDLSQVKVDPRYLNNLKYKVRMVFQWNRPGAEFELQFVNPQNRYYNWKHTNEENKERLKNEIYKEYRLEEFEFNGDDANGKWIINALSLQDSKADEEIPLVLKATIYTDYGSVGQSKELVFVHFSKFNEKKNLITLNVN